MLHTAVAIFKAPQQTKEAIEEIQGENLVNSKVSVMVLSQYFHQGQYREEIASELAYYSDETNFDKYHTWLVQSSPFVVPNLGEVVVAGPLANQLMHHPHGRGLVEVLITYGLTEIRARHYEHEVRTGHWFVLIQSEHEKIKSIANTLRGYGGRDIEIWNKEVDHPIYPKS